MTLTVKQMAIIKRIAQSIAPYTNKKAKLQDKIIEAAEQIKAIDAQMAEFQTPVKNMTGGLTTEDIIRKTIVNGTARYIPNPAVLTFNEQTRVYEFVNGEQSSEAPEEVATEANENGVEMPEDVVTTDETPSEEGTFNPFEN